MNKANVEDAEKRKKEYVKKLSFNVITRKPPRLTTLIERKRETDREIPIIPETFATEVVEQITEVNRIVTNRVEIFEKAEQKQLAALDDKTYRRVSLLIGVLFFLFIIGLLLIILFLLVSRRSE